MEVNTLLVSWNTKEVVKMNEKAEGFTTYYEKNIGVYGQDAIWK